MDFAFLPPEVNSGRMYTGPGAAPMLAAATAWDALAAELETAAVSYSEAISSLIGHAWSGPTSVAMAAAAAPYVAWLQAVAANAEQTAIQAKVVASAYEAAFAATVPPTVVAANRTLLATLVATNFFGQNTPAIAATEAAYAEMWAQDAVAMYGYAAAAMPASSLPQLEQPPQTTNPAGPGSQSAAVSHAAAGNGQALAQSTLQQFANPAAASDPPTWWETFTSELGQVTPFSSIASSGLSFDSSLYTVVSNGAGWGRLVYVRGGAEGALTFEGIGPRGVLSASTTPVTGPGVGRAIPVGGLSVPPSWATAAPEMKPIAFTLAAAETPMPVAAGLPPGMACQEAMMGTTAGQGATPDNNSRRNQKTNGKNDDQDGKPITTLTNGSGWLASSWAYHTRQREGQPLPTHWRTG
ncbi:PPE family protein [[Mycobacterium] holstebronense]|uniref:PPE family protein n=1 Tax=[Mycobacterium] holstebronense TaxID=3064288 RepID=A0ABN9MXD4_9MYCO|nr:PPE family protein [Mycolicibacter sp. MU0102]CAJ1496813.1 PPE family protein [Mycolicibacter sp. MU0102]